MRRLALNRLRLPMALLLAMLINDLATAATTTPALLRVTTYTGRLPPTPHALRARLSKDRRDKQAMHAHDMLYHALTDAPTLVSTIHCNIVLAALSDVAEWQLALVLLEHMATVSITPDAYSYSAAICACARADEPDAAVRTFKHMCASDVAKSTVVFNSALMACQRAGRHSLVVAIYTLYSLELQPDAWASGAAVRALSQLRQHGRAFALYESLEPSQRGAHAVSAALNAATRARRWDLAAAWYDDAKRQGVTVDAHMLDAALRACAAHGKQKRWRRALRLVRDAPAAADARCFTTAIRACAADGRWREALGLLRRLELSNVSAPSAHAYSAAISALRPSAKWRTAVALLRRMRSSGLALDAHCVGAALEVCAAADKWEETLSLVGSLPRLGLTPSSRHLAPMLRCCTRAGHCAEALAMLDRLGRPPLDAVATAAALEACARAADAGRVRQLISQLEADGGSLDARMRCSAIAALGRAGEPCEALQMLAVSDGADPSVDTACFNAALGALLRAGMREAAERLLESMGRGGRPPPNSVTWQVMRSSAGRSIT